MTQEQKAKAYDEALEKAKAHINSKGIGDTVDLCKHLFSELQESEDERIRKEAISIVQSYMNICDKEGDPCLSGYKVLAWLEKQKEQITDESEKIAAAYQLGRSDERKQKELSLMDGNADLYFDEWNQQKQNPTKRQCFEEGMRYAQRLQKEQKSIPIPPPCWESAIQEQKPAEWSEVELEFRGEKVTVKRPFFRDDKGRGYSTVKQDEEVAWNALRAWCEKKGISLYDLYPKAEWSEEDEDMLNSCISSIEEAKENRYAYKETDGDTSYDHEIAWLKSLRPSWKPSEEQMSALLWCIAHLGGADRRVLAELYEHLKMYCK